MDQIQPLRLDFQHLKLTTQQTHNLLASLIALGERGFLKETLSKFNIPGRTRIYTDFGYYQNVTSEIRTRHVDEILSTTDIYNWLSEFINWYPFRFLVRVFHKSNLDVQGLPLTITRAEDENTPN